MSERPTIPLSNDAGAEMVMMAMARTGPTSIEITTRRKSRPKKRNGPRHTSFSRREIDAATGRYRYLGDGDSPEEAASGAGATDWAPLVKGSISHDVAVFACKREGVVLAEAE